ncbi:hypothetical protein CCPUN_01190 [Cardinium endosymbiont of Culicoides punctatus]|nr:hypothetical protein CCPUN_01190 [Cardinium endosymbiont of Culicoides punctatus]
MNRLRSRTIVDSVKPTVINSTLGKHVVPGKAKAYQEQSSTIPKKM